VTVHNRDGAAIDPGECDAIMLINAGVTHPHRPWLDRLADGSRLVLPITAAAPGASFGSGVAAKIVRRHSGLSAQVVGYVVIYSCTGVRDPELAAPLGKAWHQGAAQIEVRPPGSARAGRHMPSAFK
jgi:protein-L-isoaspartate(D-aspartate) O-methyltransferase